MRTRALFGGCLLAVATAAGLIPAGAANAASGADAAAGTPTVHSGLAAGQPARTVTLVTGDRLRVAADGVSGFAVLPTPGRRTSFVTSTVRGHVSVTPVDAVALVR